jgi:hypothetical protein
MLDTDLGAPSKVRKNTSEKKQDGFFSFYENQKINFDKTDTSTAR